MDIYFKIKIIKLKAKNRRIGKFYICTFNILNHEIADESIVKHVRSLLVYLTCIVWVQMNLPVLICSEIHLPVTEFCGTIFLFTWRL